MFIEVYKYYAPKDMRRYIWDFLCNEVKSLEMCSKFDKIESYTVDQIYNKGKSFSPIA